MTITLPPDLERSLEEEARKRGTTLERVVIDELSAKYAKTEPKEEKAAPPADETQGGSLYDMIKDYIGTVDGPPDLSKDTGRQFGEIVEEKHRRISEKFARERRKPS